MKQFCVARLSPRVILAIVFGLSLSLFLLIGFFQSQLYTKLNASPYLVFHNIVEFFSVMVSLSIFGVGWFTFDQSRNRHALFLGSAFLAIGLIDFMHALSFPGMPDFFTPSSTNKGILFWLSARAITGCAFLVSAFIYPETRSRWLSKYSLLTAALALVGLAFVGVIYYENYLPPMFIEGIGLTPLKLYLEYLVVGLFCLSLAAYWYRLSKTEDRILIYYMAAFILCIFSELAFTLYKSAYDSYNMLGHIYKLLAFYLIYLGVFSAAVRYPYVKLVDTGEDLRKEIGERKHAENEQRRLNRELGAIRDCNQALLRADNEQDILNDVCRIICDEAGYRMAWVGFAENDNAKTIRIVAHAGAEDGYLNQAKLTWADTERGRGPSGVAVRTGKSDLIQDFATDPKAVPWRDAALQRGYRSAIALPLKDENGYAFGLLNIYSSKTNAFTPSEIRLLEELAGDLAFGINVLRTRVERKRAEEFLKKSEEEYRRIVNTASEGIWVLGPDTITTFVNPSMANILGYRAEDIIGRPMTDFMFEEDVPDYLQKMENRHKGISENYERRFRRKDGRVVFTLASTTPIFDDLRHFRGSLAMFTDITDRKETEEREKDFYRLTILAATEGKLNLTERDEIENVAGQPFATYSFSNAEDFRDIRAAIMEIARSHGMDELRAGDYRVAIGEAITNASKHAGGGKVSIHILPGALFTIVSDRGPGIEALSIPKVALEKGYTTTGTLGMGYKVMISIADRVYLATGSWGTMVGLEMSTKPPKATPDISLLYRI